MAVQASDGLLNERYRLEQQLGVGGMATVHLAVDTRLGVRRAIKILNKTYTQSPMIRERFENEAHAQARLRHPNILMVHDVVMDQGQIFMVMELADKGSLAARVKASGPLSPKESAQVGITLLGALELAHENHVVHRDIKPENVLIDSMDTLKLADFGIARVVARNATLTRTGVAMGTWAYMPPEQRNSAKSVDGRADIYALGASLYYLISGKEPFDLHNTEAYAEAYEGFPDLIGEVIKKATRFNPSDRYADCAEMRQALLEILDELPDEVLFARPKPKPNLFQLSEEARLKESTLVPFAPLEGGDDPSGETVAPFGGGSWMDAPSDMDSQVARGATLVSEVEESEESVAPVEPAIHADPNAETALRPQDRSPVVEQETHTTGSGLRWLLFGVPLLGMAAAAVITFLPDPPRAEPATDKPAVALVEKDPAPPKANTEDPQQEDPPEPATEPTKPAEPPRGSTTAQTPPAKPSAGKPKGDDKPDPSPDATTTKASATAPQPPPEGSAEPVYKGVLVVRVEPYGAYPLFIGGKQVGTAGRTQNPIPVGTHQVLIKGPDGQGKVFETTIVKGQVTDYCWDFEADAEC